MAQNSEFWLPPHFLTDDDTPFTSSTNDHLFNAVSTTLFPHFVTHTTTEKQQHHITELTRRMTHSSLHQQNLTLNNHKGVFLNDSPQSTLYALSCRNDAVLNMNEQRVRFDLLQPVAGKNEKIHRVFNDEEAFDGFAPKTQNHHNSISYQKQLQIAQFEMLKKEWLKMKQEEEFLRDCEVFAQMKNGNYQNVLRRGRNDCNGFHRNVFLGNPNLKKERNGTGVFLPRSLNTESSRKKPVCKNVVVPERVVHALNRKVEEGMIRGYMQQKNRFYGTSNNENDFARNENGYGFSQQKRNLKPQQTHVNREIMLPQEWTY